MNEETFVTCLQKKLIQDSYITSREVDVGYGRADLVFAPLDTINRQNCKKRYKFDQLHRLMREEHLTALRNIPDYEDDEEPIYLDELSLKIGISTATLKRTVLKFLIDEGYIISQEKHSYVKRNGWMPLFSELYAIEAKLSDWKRGYLQALRYKSFSNKVYLAMPMQKMNVIDTKMFKTSNIGVLGFDVESNNLSVIVDPGHEDAWNMDMKNLAIESFWNESLLKELALV